MTDDEAPRARAMEPARWDRLLRAAAHEFAEAGYEAASLNRVLTGCGLSKSSFYHYLGSKQELFDAVIREFGPALVERMQVPAPGDLAPDFWGGLAGVVERLLGASHEDEVYLLLGRMWYLPGAPEGEGTSLFRSVAAVDRWLAQALEVGRETGAVRRDLPTELQARLFAALVRVFDEWSVHHRGTDDLDARELARRQLEATRRLLGT